MRPPHHRSVAQAAQVRVSDPAGGPVWGDAAHLVDLLDVRPEGPGQFVSVARADERRPVAEGSQMLGQAADVISQNPVTLQLRYLQTLNEIGSEQNTTVVFPLPVDTIAAFFNGAMGKASPAAPASSPTPVPEPSRSGPTPRPDLKGAVPPRPRLLGDDEPNGPTTV